MTTPNSPSGRSQRGILGRFRRERSGATALEYGILMMMVAIALVGMSTLTNLANKENDTFNQISNSLR